MPPLIVTGGGFRPSRSESSIPIDSTETLVLGDTEWRTLPTARLPSPRSYFGAATIDNKVFIFGKNIIIIRLSHLTILMLTGGAEWNEVEKFNTIHSLNVRSLGAGGAWELVGQMTVPRSMFAIEVIEDVAQQCP